ncbi:hypothetical protein K493DRAFT_340197 [Basidiobolus meristosporus CBS 931.73]|uniref:Nucleolar pre-ribosomal-associated protein 1 n=1 Tax=Basidiobolus meristosporus CBS 931.73 TaxID=1314790 RepID=A0A1Y1XWP6_9FUNG|nr:hypothetical protein K493DRAFT_340197 [Basidiobolus meristosporus CBS 931.73]|eukprot:ORX90170.1 hypothetical protein K493DRAFT_340197 [Basidiobolus meristosporus CBS 931.73]
MAQETTSEEYDFDTLPDFSTKYKLYENTYELTRDLTTDHIDVVVQALQRFRYQLSLDNEESLRVFFNYLSESPECEELFKIWDLQQKNSLPQLEVIIVDVLARVIRLTNTPITRANGVNIARRVFRNYLKTVYRNLSSGRVGLICATIELLTAMTKHTLQTTREMIDTFNFELKAHFKLLNMRQNPDVESKKRQKDVRTLYIRFILAFLECGDAKMKGEVLEIKDFVSSLFKGLFKDSYEVVEYVLGVFEKHIVTDGDVKRSTLTNFMNQYILEQLVKLYGSKESLEGDDTKTVPDLVHQFLRLLCCTPGVGLCFHDAGWYPSHVLSSSDSEGGKGVRVQNRVLHKFVNTLRPTDDLKQQELVIGILRACPELVQHYWNASLLSFDPRLSSKWIANMSFLHKVIALPVPKLELHSTGSFLANPPPTGNIVENILPAIFNRTLAGKCLQHTSPLVKYMSTLVLNVVFRKLHEVTKAMNEVVEAFEEPFGSATGKDSQKKPQQINDPARKWRSSIQSVRDEIKKRIPDFQIIISLQHSCSTMDKNSRASGDEEAAARGEILHECVLRLIKYYQHFLPDIVLESKFDFGKLIPENLSVLAVELQIHVLEMLKDIPDFKWSGKAPGASHSHLTSLLVLYLSSPYVQIQDITQEILVKLLSESVLFEHNKYEVTKWLTALPKQLGNKGASLEENQLSVLSFLDDVVLQCLRTPYKYVDDVNAMQKLATAKLSTTTADENQMVVDGEGAGSDTLAYPYSPLLCTAFEKLRYMWKSEKTDKKALVSVAYFVNRLVVSLAHIQILPYALYERFKVLCEDIEISLKDFHQSAQLHDVSQWNEKDYIANTLYYLSSLLSPVYDENTRFVSQHKLPNQLSHSSDKSWDKRVDTLLKSESLDVERAREEFIGLLSGMPVSVFDRYLRALASYCRDRLDWPNFDPLTGYWEARPVVDLSIFDLDSVIKASKKQGQDDRIILDFLGHLPFSTLLNRVSPTIISSSQTLDILSSVISKAPAWSLLNDLKQILTSIYSMLMLSKSTSEQHSSTRYYICASYYLVKCILDKANAEESHQVFEQFLEAVFGHSLEIDLYLENQKTVHGVELQKEDLGQFTYSISELLYQFTLSNAPASASRFWVPYKIKVVQVLLDELRYIELNQEPSINPEAVVLFSMFSPVCEESVLSNIMNSLIAINYESIIASKDAESFIPIFVSLLSITLSSTSFTKQSTSLIERFVEISIKLLSKFSSNQLDGILKNCVEAFVPPLGYKEETNPTRNDFVRAENQLFSQIPASVGEQLMDLSLRSLNDTRSKILNMFILSSAKYRLRFVEWMLEVLAKSNALDLSIYMESIATFLFVLGGSDRIEEIRLNAFVTNKDRQLLTVLGEKLGDDLVQKVSEAQTTPSQSSQFSHLSYEAVLLAYILQTSDSAIANRLSTSVLESKYDSLTLDSLVLARIALRKQGAANAASRYVDFCLETATPDYDFVDDDFQAKDDFDNSIFDQLNSLLKFYFSLDGSDVNKKALTRYVIESVKRRLTCSARVQSIITALGKLSEVDKSALVDVIEAIFAHHRFEELYREAAHDPENWKAFKLSVVRLIHATVVLNPVGCSNVEYLPKLLGMYGASTSSIDRLILHVLFMYEVHTKSSMGSAALLWGAESTYLRLARQQLTDSAIILESLSQLDPMKMLNSARRFPVDQSLEFSKVATFEQLCHEPSGPSDPVYDPSFVLPLFATLHSYGNQMDCRKFIEINGLGYTISSLSSTKPEIRRIGYYILDEFYVLLDTAQFREKRQVTLLLESFKNAITDRDTPARVPAVVVGFITQALAALLKPDHFMYPLINGFLLQRPIFDLNDIPLFYNLFNSSADQYKKERLWMLRLLASGLTHAEDFRVYKRRHALDLLMGYMNSPICDSLHRKLIFETLFHATAIPFVATDMVANHGLIAWLNSVVLKHSTPGNEVIVATFRLVLRACLNADVKRLEWQAPSWIEQVLSLCTCGLQLISDLPAGTETPYRYALLSTITQILHFFALVQPTKTTLMTYQIQLATRILVSLEGHNQAHSSSSDIRYIGRTDDLGWLYQREGIERAKLVQQMFELANLVKDPQSIVLTTARDIFYHGKSVDWILKCRHNL